MSIENKIRAGMLRTFLAPPPPWDSLDVYRCAQCRKEFPTWVDLVEHWLDGRCEKRR